MKLKEFRSALQERPWLLVSIGQVTGAHPLDDMKRGIEWRQHVEKWAVRNVSEITVRCFDELDLNERAEFIRYPFGTRTKIALPNGWTTREFESFTHTEIHIFTHKTYQPDFQEYDFKRPYSECWVASSTSFEGNPPSIRQGIHGLRRPSYSGPMSNFEVDQPHVFDAVVRITKVGIHCRCSAAIVDIFLFPEGFDPASV